MDDETTGYVSHDTDGFTVETNSATVDQLEENFAAPDPADDAADASASPAEPPASAESDAPEKLTPFRKGAKPRDDAFARMKQATDKLAEANRLREAAERERDELKARLSAPERQPQSSSPAQAAPKAATFPTYDTYIVTHPDASWDEWNDAKIEHITEARLTAREQRQAHEREQAEQLTIGKAHDARMATIGSKYPDFTTVRDAADAALAQAGIHQLPAALVRAVVTSDKSDDLVYFLGAHPEEAIQLARESADAPVSAAPVLRRYLESKLSGTAALNGTGSAATTRSTAKPPVNPVGGSASATPQPLDDLEFGPEYVRRMNKVDAEKGRRTW